MHNATYKPKACWLPGVVQGAQTLCALNVRSEDKKGQVGTTHGTCCAGGASTDAICMPEGNPSCEGRAAALGTRVVERHDHGHGTLAACLALPGPRGHHSL